MLLLYSDKDGLDFLNRVDDLLAWDATSTPSPKKGALVVASCSYIAAEIIMPLLSTVIANFQITIAMITTELSTLGEGDILVTCGAIVTAIIPVIRIKITALA